MTVDVNSELLPNPRVDRIIHEEFEKMDDIYQSLSLRFESIGDLIFTSKEEKQSYLYGIAAGFKELESQGKVVGKIKRHNITDDIPVVDAFYKDELLFLNEARENGNLSEKIKEKTDKTAREDIKYYDKLRRNIQAGLVPLPHHLGVSMIHDFVVNKAAKPTR